MAAKIQTGDTVVVIAGKDKGKSGIVLSVIKSSNRILVEGINLVKKHVKPNPNAGVEGGIVTKESSLHLSNVKIFNPVSKKPDRVTFKFIEKDGRRKKVRYFVSNQEPVDI